ncbi:Lipoyl synthase [Limihaloglobus sulfuriphilus]|uniref:Lipoyl synthase n=1 Tax=Limihaloglobus sulfuriphilus TaxID=1851148 RepID=A0A1R7T624_9BACT|nr:lipoyl synthase [Limihaloglobus sulfuriphilus]AQQ72186.1 Lipoyl synthase [Limihaloglobus sulfuriphilus]
MTVEKENKSVRRLPPWLKRPMGIGETFSRTNESISGLGIETICDHANCPNKGECWSRGTATVLILGGICTRNCKFCSVGHGKPLPPDPTEPARVAELARRMKLKYLVITSVDRDDLQDGGASQFRDVVLETRKAVEGIQFELLVPDFRDSQEKSIEILAEAFPFVFGHNIETVPQLYPIARPGGDYQRSLNLLLMVKEKYPRIQTKSSIMLGLGETDEQVLQTLKDLRRHKCDRVSLGQYLRPSKESLEVAEYVTPEKFDQWAQKARQIGFSWVMSSPFTRSSYHAEEKQN